MTGCAKWKAGKKFFLTTREEKREKEKWKKKYIWQTLVQGRRGTVN